MAAIHWARPPRLHLGRVLALVIVATGLSIMFGSQNVAFMVSLAFALAASANFSGLAMSLLWQGCTTRGVMAGGGTGWFRRSA